MNFFVKITKNLPSWAWIILIVFGIGALIGGIILFFVGLSTVEGFGSGIILLIAIAVILAARPQYLENPEVKGKVDNFMIGMGIFFFALMATVIDQTGNPLYNKPLEILYCPVETRLNRSSDISHPLPGRTDITQDFRCIDSSGNTKQFINPLQVIMIRFVEYVLFIYAVRFIIALKLRFMARASHRP